MSTLAPARAARAPRDLAARVAFLRDASSYSDGTKDVEAIETHLSWVFLTRSYAYKLKKPLRFDHLDLREPGARRAHCRLEIRLNRRLAEDVYLGEVPLTADARGRLRLGGDGTPVDWLVKMRRLPGELMLDRMLARSDVRPRDIDAVAAVLARFYRTCAPEPLTPAEWRARLIARISESARELAAAGSSLDAGAMLRLGERQLAATDRLGDLLDRRVEDGLVIEGHGDLRPEHICLGTPIAIIDCLEFSRGLRIVDAAEELGFLALECERLGAPAMRRALFGAYAAHSGDAPPAALVDFYQSLHACVRARLALRHLADEAVDDHEKWIARANGYAALAEAHIAAAEA